MLWKGNLSYFCKESGSASCILPLYSNRYKAPFCSSSTNSFIYAISSRFVCNSLFTNSMDSFTSFWALCSVIQSLPAKVMIIPNMTARKLRKKSPNLYSVLICFAFFYQFCFHVFLNVCFIKDKGKMQITKKGHILLLRYALAYCQSIIFSFLAMLLLLPSGGLHILLHSVC